MVRHVTPVVNVKDTTPVKVMDVPDGRKVIVKKMLALNKDSSVNTVVIMDGDEDRSVGIAVDAGSNLVLGESQMPHIEIEEALYVRLTAAGTNGVDVQFEVDVE